MRLTEFQHRNFLVMREVAALLRCSTKTVQRLIKAGKLTATYGKLFDPARISRTSFEAYIGDALSKCNFDPEPSAPLSGAHVEGSSLHSDVGRSSTDVQSEPSPESSGKLPEHPLDPIEAQRRADLEFAERYLAGQETDSSGNRVGPASASLLGPIQRQERRRPNTTAHMDERLVANADAAPNPVNSDDFNELWHPGHKDRVRAMYQQSGLRQPSEQEKKKALDVAAVRAAFQQGYSR